MMTSGNSQSQLDTKSKEISLTEYKDKVKNALNKRFQSFYDAKEESVNISTRYDFLIRMEEIKAIFDLLFNEDNL